MGRYSQVSDKRTLLVHSPLTPSLLNTSPPKPEPMSCQSLWDRPPRDGERVQAHHTQESVKTYGLPSLIPIPLSSLVPTVVPKQNTIFALAVPLYSTLSPSATERDPTQTLGQEDSKTQWTVLDKPYIEFDLYGNQFCFRSADRSNRKFKAKETIEL